MVCFHCFKMLQKLCKSLSKRKSTNIMFDYWCFWMKKSPKQNHPVSLWCPTKNLRGEIYPRTNQVTFLGKLSKDGRSPNHNRWTKSECWDDPDRESQLVGGWIEPPIWKICASQNGFIFPNFQGENSKNIWNHHPARFWDSFWWWLLVMARCLMKMPLWVYDSLGCLGILGVILRNPQLAVNLMSSLETLHIMSVAKGVMTQKTDVV